MSIADDIKAVLVADNGVTGANSLFTGGIYTFNETGRTGISRQSTPSAYDVTTYHLKPCCVIRARARVSDSGPKDDASQVYSYRQVVEVWFYIDSSGSLSTLETAQARVFTVLAGKRIGTDKRTLRWVGDPVWDDREIALERAYALRSDYETRGLI